MGSGPWTGYLPARTRWKYTRWPRTAGFLHREDGPQVGEPTEESYEPSRRHSLCQSTLEAQHAINRSLKHSTNQGAQHTPTEHANTTNQHSMPSTRDQCRTCHITRVARLCCLEAVGVARSRSGSVAPWGAQPLICCRWCVVCDDGSTALVICCRRCEEMWDDGSTALVICCRWCVVWDDGSTAVHQLRSRYQSPLRTCRETNQQR